MLSNGSGSHRKRPHTPPVPVIPLEPIITPPPATNHDESFPGPPRLSNAFARNVQPGHNANQDQLLYMPRITPQAPPVPRKEDIAEKSDKHDQDQLLEQLDRLHNHHVHYLNERRQQVEEQVVILLNWQHVDNPMSHLTLPDRDFEYTGSASNLATSDSQQQAVFAGWEQELKIEIHVETLGGYVLPWNWETNTPIQERLEQLLGMLDNLHAAKFQFVKDQVWQMSYEEAVAKRDAYAHILRIGERNAITAPVAMTAVGNFEIIAKVVEERRDSQVAQEESGLEDEGWYSLR